MLDIYRFNNNDLEDVKLQDPTKYDTYDEGQWLTPLGNAANEWAMSASATLPTDPAANVSKMLFMEKGRSDSKAVGKMTVISGRGVVGKTDVFIVPAAPSDLAVGAKLTIKKDADGVVKFAAAADGDAIKGFVRLSPAMDTNGYLHFELA